ncbi:MAG TPA: hypothetical protein VGA68_02550 [Woeseiaceae bacterium]|jgi:hypothetical protein
MNTQTHRFAKAAIATSIAFAALLLASCSLTGPRQVDANNPSVTYKYASDEQLIEANQRAITYCSQYDSMPGPGRFSRDPDGSNIVVFECIPGTLSSAPMNQSNSGLTYNYRTDQELLEVSRNAQTYCVNHGSPEMDSTITHNSDGSKTVTFRCNAS